MCRWIEQPSRHTTSRASAPPPAAAASRGPYRVSDAEREEVIAQLRGHTADGRLTLEEFEARVDEVWQAKTGTELDIALRELPPARRPAPARSGTTRKRWSPSPLARRVRAALVVGVLVSLALGQLVVWPFLVGFFVFGGGCHWSASHIRHEHRREDAVTYV